MEYLFPEYRLDWFGAGPSSPNKTGALLAIVFVAAWWPTLRFRWGFWLSLPMAFVSAVFLLQTESRGALVAAGAAVVLLAVFWLSVWPSGGTLAKASRYVFSLRALVLMAALSVLVLYSQQLGVNDRMTMITTGEDESANVRVALYSAGLQMIAAAPLGWGHGKAGDAYGQWYQEIGDSRSYLSLVNSHLTWMAEGGMLFQFLYIAGWALVFMLCWPLPWTPLRAVAFGSWVTLGLCGFFSSVLTLAWLWLIPGALLLLCIVQRFRSKLWPTRRQRFIASFAVLSGFVGLQAARHALTGAVRIEATPDRVEIGDNPKAVAVIQPDRQILGDKYGHTLREYLDEAGGFTVLREPMNAVDLAGFDTVVLSGGMDISDLREFEGSVFWMNPPADVDEAALEGLGGRPLTVVVGSLGDWRRLRVWQSLVDTNSDWDLIQLRGVADFIPNWPKYLIAEGAK